MQASPVVAVVNTNPDVVWMLRLALQKAGFIVVTAHIEEIKNGTIDVEGFLLTDADTNAAGDGPMRASTPSSSALNRSTRPYARHELSRATSSRSRGAA